MTGRSPQGVAVAASGGTPIVELVPRAPKQIGSVVRARRGFRSETAIILDVGRGAVEIAWLSGEIANLPPARIKQTVAGWSDDIVYSAPGRLLRFLTSKLAEPYRTEAVMVTIRQRIDELAKRREHAMGLLLDRRPLALSLNDCLSLGIEAWRVRYEFLVGDDAGEAAMGLARAIVSDPDAPAGVRAAVAIKFAIPAREVSSDAGLVFGSEAVSDFATLAPAAVACSRDLIVAGVAQAETLAVAVRSPTQLAPSITSAAVLASLSGETRSGVGVTVDPTIPMSIVDDLVDRGVPIDVKHPVLADGPSGRGTSASYILARTDPGRLTANEILALDFGSEATRRYLAGDLEVETALPGQVEVNVKALRAAVDGKEVDGHVTDPLVREMLDVLAAEEGARPSERLLADRSVWPTLIRAGVPGSADNGPLGEEFAGMSALARASTALFEWRWKEARAIAREGLRESRREAVRDELLNIMACSLWLEGQPEPALAALDDALAGAYSDALLINASVVATELEHDSAVERLVKLARQAPSAHHRAVAAERALVLWSNDDGRIWEDDNGDALPSEIRGALRTLISEDLPGDRYRRILRVLADRDAQWLTRQGHSAFGANAEGPNRVAVRIYRARAAGVAEYVASLASELRQIAVEDWLRSERDAVVEAATEALMERSDEIGAAFFGLALIEADLPMSSAQQILLKSLTVISIVSNVDPEEAEPHLKFIDLVRQAHSAVLQLPPVDQSRLGPLVAMAADRLAGCYLSSRHRQFDQAREAFAMVVATIRAVPERNLNRQAVRQACDSIREFCADTRRVLGEMHPLVADRQLVRAIDLLINLVSELGAKVGQVTR